METYPKTAQLKDGTQLTLRPMVRGDAPALHEFFLGLSAEDRLFLKEDVTRRAVIDRWEQELDYNIVLPILALIGERVVGDATLHTQPHGWSRHVGEIRCVVAGEVQGRGVGTLLAREIFRHAQRRGLTKIIAQMAENQTAAQRVFSKLGFKREAVLKNHVTDVHGRLRNLVIMANDTETLWRQLEEMYMGMEVKMEHGARPAR